MIVGPTLDFQRAMIGQTIGHYEILEKIGEGGMGVVYRARDVWLDRFVALKFLAREVVSARELKARFIQEAKAASALDHPNICTIHTIDETEDGQLFIAMAFYDGETVKTKMRRGLMSSQEIIDVARQVAAGLQTAHERGIVHLDIKPANLMVTRDGTVKILDFGLSRFTSQTSERSRSGPLMGTVAYMSPERVKSEPAGPESDIWSLGVVLYEMATGTRPFHGGSDMSVLYAVVHREFVPAVELAPDLPMELDRIIRRTLLKDRRYRYRNAGQLLGDLDNLQQSGQAMTATVPWIYHRPWRYGSPAQRLGGTVAAVALLFLIVGALIWTAWHYWSDDTSPLGGLALEDEPILLVGFLNQGEAEDEWLATTLAELLDFELDEVIRVGWLDPPEDVHLPHDIYDLPSVFDPERGFLPRVLRPREPQDPVHLVTAGTYLVQDDKLRVQLQVQDLEAKKLATVKRESAKGDLFELVSEVADELINELDIASPKRPIKEPEPAVTAEVATVIEKTKTHLRRYEAMAARDLLEEALQQQPGTIDFQLHLVDALLLLGRKGDAREVANEVVDNARSLRQLLKGRAALMTTTDDLDRATALGYALWSTASQNARDEYLDEGLSIALLLSRTDRGEAALKLLAPLAEEFPEDPRVPLTQSEAVRDMSRDQQLTFANRAIELANSQNSPMIVAAAYRMEAEAYREDGRYEEALDLLRQAESIYSDANDLQGKARTLNLIGSVYEEAQRLSDAKAAFEQAARFFGEIGNNFSQRRMLINQAIVHLLQGNYGAAIEIASRTLDLPDSANDQFSIAAANGIRGEAYCRIGRFEEAEDSFNTALRIFEDMDRPAWVASHLYLLGEFLTVRGNLIEAYRHLERAAWLQEQAGETLARARSLNGQVRVLILQGQLDKAQQFLGEAQAIFADSSRASPEYAETQTAQATILLHQGELDEAQAKFQEALAIQDQLADPLWASRTRLSLVPTLVAQGQLREAKELSRQVVVDLNQNRVVVDLVEAYATHAEVLVLLGELDAAQEEIEIAENLLGEIQAPIARLELGIAQARLGIARTQGTDDSAVKDALHDLIQRLLAETATGFPGHRLEVELLAAEALLAGSPRLARNELQTVADDATNRGYLLIADKARQLLN